MCSTSRPESLGLKHLALRPKKMQLIEDRQQAVAKENAKLMEIMTGIMNEKRAQPKHVKLPSLNEPVRRRTVDSINFENKLLMQRLKNVPSVINKSKLEKDFEHHLKAEKNLRRRQMKPLALPKDLHATSPLRLRGTTGDETGELFNASLYTAQRGNLLRGSSLDMLSQSQTAGGGIRSVTDFRREVIASKKTQQLTHTHSSGALHGASSSLHVGEMHMSMDSLPHHAQTAQPAAAGGTRRPPPGAIFELNHNAAATY